MGGEPAERREAAGSEGKQVLKRALEPLLPREVLYRSKMGFAVPLDMWFRGSLRNHIAQTSCAGRVSPSSGVVRRPDALADRGRPPVGPPRHSALLWSLLMFDGFLRNHGADVFARRGSSSASAVANGRKWWCVSRPLHVVSVMPQPAESGRSVGRRVRAQSARGDGRGRARRTSSSRIPYLPVAKPLPQWGRSPGRAQRAACG